jgi:hypothetical protein
MKSRMFLSFGAQSIVFFGLFAGGLLADTIKMKSGATIQGIIQKMENGRVTVQVNGAPHLLNLLEIDEINFDTPHLTEGTEKFPVEHFLKDLDAQEIIRLSDELKQVRTELRGQLDQIKKTWQAKQPIGKDAERQWNATKETFLAPMKRYQEIVRELYLHALAQVEDYNNFASEADRVYVGTKGIFNVGSPLLPLDMVEVTPKQVVPKSWYDKIYYDGYSRGYKEGSAFERLNILPPAQGSPDQR